jgi:hypothetical protein
MSTAKSGFNMIINSVMLRLKNRDLDIQKVIDALLGMEGRITVLKDIQVKKNIRQGAASYDLIFFTKFESQEDMDIYISDSVHQGVGKLIGSMIESQAAVCYETI